MLQKSFTAKNKEIKLSNIYHNNLPDQDQGYEILAVKNYCFPLKETEVLYSVLEKKRLNIIEENILKMASNLEPAPLIKECAEILSLDQEIIYHFSKKLAENNLLEKDISTVLLITDSGKNVLENNEERIEKIRKTKLSYDHFVEQFKLKNPFSSKRDSDFFPDKFPYVNWEKASKYPKEKIDNKLIEKLNIEESEIQEILEVNDLKDSYQLAAVVLIYDVLNEELIIKVLSAVDGRVLVEHQKRLNKKLSKMIEPEEFVFNNDIFAEDFKQKFLSDFELDFIAESEINEGDLSYYNNEYIKELEAKLKSRLEAKRKGESDSDLEDGIELEYITREKIRPKFLELVDNAEVELIVFSGWITERAVDNKLIRKLQGAADRGVLMLFGWGYNDKMEDKDREKNKKMKKRLSQIKTPSGLEAVSLYWLGNHHQKEVLCDRKEHLVGSHNFLSYRGDKSKDHLLKNESVLYHNFELVISKMLSNSKMIFIKAMKRDFKKYIRNFNGNIAGTEAVSGWIVLNKEAELLHSMKTVLQRSKEDKKAVFLYLEKMIRMLLERESLCQKDFSERKEKIIDFIEDNFKSEDKDYLMQILR